jgi:hypothetical protein
MKHAILGAGAIGGLVGAVLSSLGETLPCWCGGKGWRLSREPDAGAPVGNDHGADESRGDADGAG